MVHNTKLSRTMKEMKQLRQVWEVTTTNYCYIKQRCDLHLIEPHLKERAICQQAFLGQHLIGQKKEQIFSYDLKGEIFIQKREPHDAKHNDVTE